jgi:hypothetical protein
VSHVKSEAAKAGSGFETGEDQLVDYDRGKADQCDRQRVTVEHCHAEKRQAEEDEVNGDSEHINWRNRPSTSRQCSRWASGDSHRK